jgi:O-antigen/teichoic acid export membrane protein
MSISDKIFRNTAYNVIGRFWSIIVGIILIPYIVSHIGVERFGVWSIIGVITGYFGLLDFGIGTSFVKYIAEFYTRKEFSRISRVVSTGVTFYFILGIVIMAIAFIFISALLGFLKVPAGLYNEARFAFVIGIMIFTASNALSPFGAIQAGLQRMDVSTMIAVFLSALNVAGTVFFIERGFGLRGLMVNNAMIFCVSSVLTVIFSRKLLPELRFNPFLLDKKILKELFSFGYKLQVSRLANIISFQTDKVLISYFLGIGSVTFYQLGSSITQQVRQMALLSVSAFVPAVSELEAKSGQKALKEFYLVGSKYLILISIPLTFFLMADARLIIQAWMGKGYNLAAWVIMVLAPGYCMATISGVASSIAMGVARTDLDMKFGIVAAVLSLVLNIILVIKIGFIGVAIGSAASLIIATVYYLKLFHGYLESPVQEFIRLLYKPLLASAVACSAVLVLNSVSFQALGSPARLIQAVIIAAGGVVFFLIYSCCILAFNYLDDYDRSLLSAKIPLLRPVLKRK